MEVIDDRVHPWREWEELRKSYDGHNPNGTVGVIQRLQV